MSRGRRGGSRLGAVAASGVFSVVVWFGGCGGDDSSDDTLSPLDPTAGAAATSVTPTGDDAPSAQTTVDPAQAGSGFVSIQVRLPAVGVDETISLDRATVRADALDPVSLDATCTPLDGGEGLTVSVVDLRRLGAGARLVSAALRVDGESTAGPHDVTLDLGADQVTTRYTGTIELAEGGWSGTFDVTDAAGGAASGSFVCAEQPVVTTSSAAPAGGGEEVPGSEPPPPTT